MSVLDFSANAAHMSAVNAAEAKRQADEAALSTAAAGFSWLEDPAGNVYPNAQRALNAIAINFYRSCLASAVANNVSGVPYVTALQALGTGGA